MEISYDMHLIYELADAVGCSQEHIKITGMDQTDVDFIDTTTSKHWYAKHKNNGFHMRKNSLRSFDH